MEKYRCFLGTTPENLLPEHAKCKRQVSVRDCTKSARRRFRTQDVSYLEPHLTTRPHETCKLGVKIVNGEGHKIIITPEDFKRFWQKVNQFKLLSMSGVHYGHYKAAI
jgi:hypothetical protein